jgi:hypothetical protein
VRPPLDLHIQSLIRLIPLESAPKKLGHNRGTLFDRGRQNSFRRAHEARCDFDASEELLMRYDEILEFLRNAAADRKGGRGNKAS